ncbi:MAG: hypothetical protein GY757_06525, partial [bacterium]|nr:hypothetical protein [bacterium]
QILRRESEGFSTLIFTWIEFIVATHQDRDKEPVRHFKMPSAYYSLLQLKDVFARLGDFARGISLSESLFDKKQCFVLIRMGDRFIQILDRWIEVLRSWLGLLGEGTPDVDGVLRRLKDRIDYLAKIIKESESMRTPYFQMNDRLREDIYRNYFQELEKDIADSIYWLPQPGERLNMGISGFDRTHIYKHDSGDDEFDNIFRQLTALPGGFAARRNQWHRFSIDEFLQMSEKNGVEQEQKYLVPALKNLHDDTACFMNTISYQRLQKNIPTGVSHQTIESENPLARGFIQLKLNHEIFAAGGDDEFKELPPFIFNEE